MGVPALRRVIKKNFRKIPLSKKRGGGNSKQSDPRTVARMERLPDEGAVLRVHLEGAVEQLQSGGSCGSEG